MDKLTAPISPADVSAVTDMEGLARLKAQAKANSPEALKQVAQQFEALFLEMMLKSMREASLGEGIFDSDASNLYRGMFDKQIAMDIARTDGKGLGIADMLIRQLSPKGFEAAAPVPASPATSAFKPATPADFVREILPHAQKAAAALKVHPLGLIAQAAVETGWGQHVVNSNNGGSSMNLFGIKAGNSWQGPKAVAGTLEFENGLPVPRQASFRSYGSIAESFEDYVKLVGNSPRYKEVLEQGVDLEGFANAIGRSGYATDPEYANKIKGVLSSDTLRNALASLKPGPSGPMTST